MGKNNKARRAAKAKSRAKARARSGPAERGWAPTGESQWFTPHEQPAYDEPMIAAVTWRMAAERRGEPSAGEFVRRLDRLSEHGIYHGAENLLREHLEGVWAGGWQPAELCRQGRLGCSSAAAARLVTLAVAVDHANRRASTLDPRWVEQVDSLALPLTNGAGGWLGRWVHDEALRRDSATEVLLDALGNLLGLPVLEPLLPPPGTSAPVGRPRGGHVDPVLQRIRNLLAKAESTSFEAEATAFTAKAQELMTRHAVDEALLDSSPDARPAPVEIRVPVDAPYADAKSLLLQTVAEAGRCRAVFMPRVSMSTVVGYPGDVAGVDLLFTSLLVQAQHALSQAAATAAPGTRTRSQSYRSAFLLAFTNRIGDRLREINQAVFTDAETEHGGAFLPVLSSMAEAIDDFMAERFEDSYTSRIRGGYDAAGWAGGRLAADSARLSFGDLAE